MGFGLYSVAPVPLTLSQLSVILPTGTIAKVTDYGGSIAISDGVRWRLERLYLSWAGLPPASLVPIGTEASVSDCGGAIAVAGVSGWAFRPIEIFNSVTQVALSGTTSTAEQTAYTCTIPASLLGVKGKLLVLTNVESSVISANAKYLRIRYGGTQLDFGSFLSTTRQFCIDSGFRNLAVNSQKCLTQGCAKGPTTAVTQTAAIDSSVNQAFAVSGQLVNTAESLTFYGCSVVIQPGM